MPDPGRLVTLPANHHQIGKAQRGFSLYNSPLKILLGIGTSMPFKHVKILNHSPLPTLGNAQDLSPLSTVFPGQNNNLIISLDM